MQALRGRQSAEAAHRGLEFTVASRFGNQIDADSVYKTESLAGEVRANGPSA